MNSHTALQAKKRTCAAALNRGPAVRRSVTEAPVQEELQHHSSARKLSHLRSHHMVAHSPVSGQSGVSPKSHEAFVSQKRKHLVEAAAPKAAEAPKQKAAAAAAAAAPTPVTSAPVSPARSSYSQLDHDRKTHGYTGTREVAEVKTPVDPAHSHRDFVRQKKLHKREATRLPEPEPEPVPPHKQFERAKKYHHVQLNVTVHKGAEPSSADPAWSYEQFTLQKKHHAHGVVCKDGSETSRVNKSCRDFTYNKTRHRQEKSVPTGAASEEPSPVRSNRKLREDKMMCRHTIDEHRHAPSAEPSPAATPAATPSRIRSHTELTSAKRFHRVSLDEANCAQTA